MSFLICHYVILSYKNHQFLSVTLLFCLQKNICLPPSLCYSVFKKNICLPLSLCHYVFKKHLSLSVTLLFCLQKKHLPPSVTLLLCLQKNICLPLSLCHSVFKKTSVSLCHYVILSSKKTSVSLSHYVILSENAPVGDGSGASYCCCYFFSFCLISIFHKLCYVLPHYLSSIYSF